MYGRTPRKVAAMAPQPFGCSHVFPGTKPIADFREERMESNGWRLPRRLAWVLGPAAGVALAGSGVAIAAADTGHGQASHPPRPPRAVSPPSPPVPFASPTGAAVPAPVASPTGIST